MRPAKFPETISFIHDLGVYWPDYDDRPAVCYGYMGKRLTDIDVGVNYCKRRHVAVQAGGHIGLWPLRLAKTLQFDKVVTFEPERALFNAMLRNLEGVSNVMAHDKALGDELGIVKMLPHPTAGSWRVDMQGTVAVGQITIDSLKLPECDIIQLDVEGYEVLALEGARETIANFRPVIQVEMLPRSANAIERKLRKLKYRQVEKVHNDAIFISR